MMSLNVCLAVRGVGTEQFQNVILDFGKRYPGRIAVVQDSNEGLRKVLLRVMLLSFFSGGLDNEQLIQASLELRLSSYCS